MGVMRDTLEALKSVVLLQDEVKRLGVNSAKMAERLEQLNTTVTQLAARETDFIARAQTAAKLAVSNELSAVKERLVRIETFLAAGGVMSTPPLRLQSKPDDEANAPDA